ncbi:MAG: DUF2079 domain-containing protein [Chloroflexi bacterium]|nr:DUF2079 domain-containing protein [Chloroflexota bacterium]
MMKEKSRFLRETWIFKRADLFLFFLWLVYAVVFAALSLLQHYSIGTGLDLAIYDQYVWSMSIGQFLKTSMAESTQIWNFYFIPLAIIFVPFYALWTGAPTLLVLQSVFTASAVFPIYLYAKSQLGTKLALIVSGIFLLYPPLQFINLRLFHMISLTVPLMAFACYFLLKDRIKPLLVVVLLLLMVKEEALFAVMGLGIYLLLFRKNRRWLGAALIGASILWFLFLLSVFFPWLLGRNYFEGRLLLSGNLGTNVAEIIWTSITQPALVLNLILRPHQVEFVFVLLAPLAFVSLLGIDLLFVVLPSFGIAILTSTASIESQYPSAFIACVFFAAIVGLRRLLAIDLRRLPMQNLVGLVLTGSGLASYGTLGSGPLGGRFAPSHYQGLGAQAATLQEIIERIPRDALLIAQEELLPQFSARRFIYSFPIISDYRRVDYWVAKRDLFFFDFHKGSWQTWVATDYFDPIIDRDTFILYQRKSPQAIGPYRFGDGLTLRGFSVLPASSWRGGTTLRPIAEWRAAQPLAQKYSMTLQVVDRWGHVWARSSAEPMDGAMPTDRWQVGKSMGDQYTLKLPPTMPADEYQIELSVQSMDGIDVPVFDAQSTMVGTGIVAGSISVQKNKESFEASQIQMGQRLFVDMREMRLLGFELNQSEFKLNDVAQLGIYWRARGKPQDDYRVVVRLIDSTNRVAFEQADRPAKGNYATTEWNAGEVLLDWHDWAMPATLPPGMYTLRAALRDIASGEILGDAELTKITVSQ